MLKRHAQFTRARLVLAGWYTLILGIILVAFSVALLIIYNNDIARIVLQQDFGTHVPRTLSKAELRLVLAQVRALRSTSRLDVIVIDIITLCIGGALSFFLAEKTLRPIQKSVASQKAFIADASHELKSPVATILSACEVISRSKKKTTADYQETIGIIHDQSLKLGSLISDLLSLSVLDAGNTKSLIVCSLSDVVEKETDAMSAVAKKKGIGIEKHIFQDVMIMGDMEKLRQLIVILLDNAIKFTPRGGKIILGVVQKPNPQLIVEDTGIGIEKGKQQDIFKRFYQIESSHSGEGAGLGLSIAESIMKLHNGKIEVRSELKKGSTFICTFPHSA